MTQAEVEQGDPLMPVLFSIAIQGAREEVADATRRIDLCVPWRCVHRVPARSCARSVRSVGGVTDQSRWYLSPRWEEGVERIRNPITSKNSGPTCSSMFWAHPPVQRSTPWRGREEVGGQTRAVEDHPSRLRPSVCVADSPQREDKGQPHDSHFATKPGRGLCASSRRRDLDHSDTDPF